jgi:hypothetical protein
MSLRQADLSTTDPQQSSPMTNFNLPEIIYLFISVSNYILVCSQRIIYLLIFVLYKQLIFFPSFATVFITYIFPSFVLVPSFSSRLTTAHASCVSNSRKTLFLTVLTYSSLNIAASQ